MPVDAGDVEHRIDAAAGFDHRVSIAQVGADHFDAQRGKLRRVAAAHGADAVAAGRQLFDDVLA